MTAAHFAEVAGVSPWTLRQFGSGKRVLIANGGKVRGDDQDETANHE
ncbi:hypothetical protein [Ensifer adhaerens]|nr:hypothetical protein [Ensifer adhaerens]